MYFGVPVLLCTVVVLWLLVELLVVLILLLDRDWRLHNMSYDTC